MLTSFRCLIPHHLLWKWELLVLMAYKRYMRTPGVTQPFEVLLRKLFLKFAAENAIPVLPATPTSVATPPA